MKPNIVILPRFRVLKLNLALFCLQIFNYEILPICLNKIKGPYYHVKSRIYQPIVGFYFNNPYQYM